MNVPTYNATGGRNEWATPRDFLEGARVALGLPPIELDCAALASTAVAPAYFGPDHVDPARRDAFCEDMIEAWRADGTRFLNPPYSRQCLTCADGVWKAKTKTRKGCAGKGHASRSAGDWMRAAHLAGVDDAAGPLLALPAARTSTRWWHDHVLGAASRVLFVSGRLRFLEPAPDGDLVPASTGAPFPSVLIEYAPPPVGTRWVTQFGRIGRGGSGTEVPPRVTNAGGRHASHYPEHVAYAEAEAYARRKAVAA